MLKLIVFLPYLIFHQRFFWDFFLTVLEVSLVHCAFFCRKGSKNLCVSLQIAGICPLGIIIVMTLKIPKLEAEIMLNATQESWNNTVDAIKISEIGYFL